MNKKNIVKTASKTGIKKGLYGFVWILKILIPISFLTLIIDYSGVLHKADFLLEPLMGLLSLPAVAALPLIIGLLTGIYGAVAAMSILPLTIDQMTLVAIFLLISHNMIQEGIVQGKSGINPVKATIFRLTASIITVIIAAKIIKPESINKNIYDAVKAGNETFMPMFTTWAIATTYLCLKIFAIIMTLMIVIEIMKQFKIIEHIIKIINPVVKVMGLDTKVGMLWITAGMFGIAYGAAVIVEETKENDFTDEELTRLHLSIGINHAMIEDPSLFIPLGISAVWLWIPRLITAVIAVWVLNLWYKIRPDKNIEKLQTAVKADL